MPLSVVIITFNEERNIERCIRSVMPVADEIVVVDSYSTDDTATICRKCGVRFIQRVFEGYGKQKQWATCQATHDYVLSLDADEELSEKLQDAIAHEKKHLRTSCYSFNRRNIYCGKAIRFCGWYPDKQIRLYNKKQVNWNDKNVHESVEVADKQSLIHLDGDLKHYTCYTVAEHQEKEKKYARMNAENLIRKGKPILSITPYFKYVFRFIKTYIFRLGILDGRYGFVISKTLAGSSFLKYWYAKETLKNGK